MNYSFFYCLSQIYTRLIKNHFQKFGHHSIIKPFLNTSNSKYIAIGNHVNIGSFCRITVSTNFNRYQTKSRRRTKIKIGNHVDIGNNSFISANNKIKIGNNVIISAYVFITDHDHRNDDIKKSPHLQPLTENGHVVIEDNVLIGTKSSLLKNITIGQHATIGANSVVTKNVPAYSVVAGNPARIIKQYDFKTKAWKTVCQK